MLIRQNLLRTISLNFSERITNIKELLRTINHQQPLEVIIRHEPFFFGCSQTTNNWQLKPFMSCSVLS